MSIYEPAIDPPDEPMACTWCDGLCTVVVNSVTDVSGKVHRLHVHEVVDCPRCDGIGSEPAPEPDPDRQRDEARERDAV
jgi:hypothetical protein